MQTRTWLVPLLGLLLGACTSTPGPTPSPAASTPVAPSAGPIEPIGVRVAVVLPPAGSVPLTPAGTRAAADAVASRRGDALGEVRTVVPEPGAFVGDVAILLAEQGYDLVCVVGADASGVVLDVAPSFPATRFCGTPAPAGPDQDIPDNVLLIELRIEEAAYLAGVAAGASRRPPRPPPDDESTPPPPGAMLADRSHPWTARQRAGFVAGLSSVAGARATARLDLDVTTAEAATAAATAQFEGGVPVVYLAAEVDAAGVLDAAAAHDAAVVVHRDRTRFAGEVPATVLTWLLVDMAIPLDLAVTRAVEGWEGGLVSVGVAERAIRPHGGGADGDSAVLARVRQAADRLRDGSTTILTP